MTAPGTPHEQAVDLVTVVGQIGAAITAELALDDVLSTVARHVAAAFGADECDLYELRPGEGVVVAVGLWSRYPGPEDDEWLGSQISLDEQRSFSHAIRLRRPWEHHIDDEDLPEANRRTMERWGEQAVLAVPIFAGDEPIGAMTLIQNDRPRRFTEEEHRLLSLLAVPTSLAIQHVRLRRSWAVQDRQLRALIAASQAISATIEFDELLAAIARAAGEALGSDEAAINTYEPELDALRIVAYYQRRPDDDPDEWVGRLYPLSDFPADRAILLDGQIVQETLSDASLHPANRRSMEENGEKTLLNVPLTYEGEPVGLLVLVELRRERDYTPQERQLARALGEQAGAAMHHAGLLRRTRAQNRHLGLLLESIRAISSSNDLQVVLDTVARTATELLDCDQCQIQSYDRDANTVTVEVLYSRVEDELSLDSLRQTFTLDEAPEERAFLERMEVLEQLHSDPDLAPSAREAMRKYGDRSYLNVPLVFNEAPVGVLVLVEKTRERRFSAEELALARALAEQAAIAIEHARLYLRVQEQAITDGLTGLYNHRYFYERLDQEIARARRYGAPVSMLMLDIDDFKAFNDRHGHVAGDEVLRRVARLLTDALRRGVDIAARYGGEEFAVILPNTPIDSAQAAQLAMPLHAVAQEGAGDDVDPAPGHLDGAEAVGERVRAAVAAAEFATRKGKATHLTVSVGVASFPLRSGDATDLVRNADAALYKAKRGGKDRVETYR